ncbi:hypothetical protein FA13DRAFT_1440798 [Coprinellus micaceus]|uniref:Uncharacterized protein n=1 Tax=Coprinellus micaceus TaxID=71717 RepID=A0A4Y7TMB7_COPMI|nr:hypothetical protein FA13DRAFT_1440798 [Coprinellus micaceus]
MLLAGRVAISGKEWDASLSHLDKIQQLGAQFLAVGLTRPSQADHLPVLGKCHVGNTSGSMFPDPMSVIPRSDASWVSAGPAADCCTCTSANSNLFRRPCALAALD